MEMLDILDENGNPTREIKSREEAHKRGLWHKCAHVWIQNTKGDVLLQKRSMQKQTHPGKWDISVGGHVQAGQTSIKGALREMREEIGTELVENDLLHLGTVKSQSTHHNGTYFSNHFEEVYFVKLDIDPRSIKLQEEEVDEIKFIPLNEFVSMIENEDEKLVKHPKEYEILLRYLKEGK